MVGPTTGGFPWPFCGFCPSFGMFTTKGQVKIRPTASESYAGTTVTAKNSWIFIGKAGSQQASQDRQWTSYSLEQASGRFSSKYDGMSLWIKTLGHFRDWQTDVHCLKLEQHRMPHATDPVSRG